MEIEAEQGSNVRTNITQECKAEQGGYPAIESATPTSGEGSSIAATQKEDPLTEEAGTFRLESSTSSSTGVSRASKGTNRIEDQSVTSHDDTKDSPRPSTTRPATRQILEDTPRPATLLSPRSAKASVTPAVVGAPAEAEAAEAAAAPATSSATEPTSKAVEQAALLENIRADFYECCSEGGHNDNTWLTAQGLARHWARLAEEEQRRLGRHRLTAHEKQAIALRVVQLMQEMDLKSTDRIGMQEWIHYMLLLRAGCAAKQVNSLLDRALPYNPNILQDLQGMFEAADVTGCGVLTFKEIVSMYSKKLWFFRPSGDSTQHLTDDELNQGNPEEFAREIVEAMDLDGDERITYGEFMAYILGRRKREVRLHMYDLSQGAAVNVSTWIFGEQLQGIWHTGTVVFGKEYHYSRDAVHGDPGETSFGKPTRSVHLGYTLWRKDELHHFISRELKPLYHRDTYDIVCNNCNHFTDRVCSFLLRSGSSKQLLPEEVVRQPEVLMRSMSVRALRPALNWWLRDRIATREDAVSSPSPQPRLPPGERLPLGMVVNVHPEQGAGPPVLGQVTQQPVSQPMFVTGELRENTEIGGFTPGCCGAGGSGNAGFWVRCEHGSDTGTSFGCSANPTGPEGIWVQHFCLLPEPSGACRGQVRTEWVPYSRLSAADLQSRLRCETVLWQALQAMSALGPSMETSATSTQWPPVSPTNVDSIGNDGLPSEYTAKLGPTIGSGSWEDLHLGMPPKGDCEEVVLLQA